MQKITCSLARLLGLALLLAAQTGNTHAQCSREALTAKYWQYRETLNKHFVMTDRKPEGCIGNGVTRDETDWDNLSCSTDMLHGYSLPATSIVMAPSGGAELGMGARNSFPQDPNWHDPNCADAGPDPGTNWNPVVDGIPLNPDPNSDITDQKFNFIEFGSETPHQLGWYLTVLATEYALLGQQGQFAQQQRTLEDIFLALQAYRRLDITANCLVKARYDEITEGFEAETCSIYVWGNNKTDPCLCPEKYHNIQCPGDSKWHFDIPCKVNCPWSPNLTGYSGFFIRSDETQEQEALHDPTEEKWNIDLVSGSFAMSEAPPCSSTFSKTCYMEHQVGFLSQDQLFGIMRGLAMVKRYIPANATVTTCEGETFSPLAIAKDIAKGFVKLPQNSTRHIFWPGSDDDDCCHKAVKFGECAGGNLQWTYAALEMIYNYISPEDKHNISFLDGIKLTSSAGSLYAADDPEFMFALSGLAFGNDLSGPNMTIEVAAMEYANRNDKEIFLLINNLLYPEGSPIPLNREIFEEMLCSAPCGGPCFKEENYETQNQAAYYPDFDCANTPKWTGQRWEGGGGDPDWGSLWQSRQFNGLDFMALYNIYMLHYPSEQTPFYDPSNPPLNGENLFGSNLIDGPSVLCAGQSGTYLINSSYPYFSTLHTILWEGSSNMEYLQEKHNPTVATMVSVSSPSYIGVNYIEERRLPQYYNG